MKRITAIIALLTIVASLHAQKYISKILPMQDGKVVYTAVVPADSTMTSDILYTNATIWASNAFVNKNKAIKNQDFQNKLILIETRTPEGFHDRNIWIFYYNFKMILEFKDKRWRYKIYDITCKFRAQGLGNLSEVACIETWHPDTDGIYNQKQLEGVEAELYRSYEQLDTYIRNVIADMTKSISTPVEQW